MKSLTKRQYWAYFLLAARVLLAWTLFRYGWAKLTHTMFGVDQNTMDAPLKRIDLMRLSWYLADHEPFNSFVGLSQLGVVVLLVFNRTVVLGALLSIPIWLNILVWDMTFMKGFSLAFTCRLSFYLLLTGLLIYQARAQTLPALQRITSGERGIINFPVWAYLLLPVAAIGVELIGAIPNAILSYVRLLEK